jgi:hypothetical protein
LLFFLLKKPRILPAHINKKSAKLFSSAKARERKSDGQPKLQFSKTPYSPPGDCRLKSITADPCPNPAPETAGKRALQEQVFFFDQTPRTGDRLLPGFANKEVRNSCWSIGAHTEVTLALQDHVLEEKLANQTFHPNLFGYWRLIISP